MKKEQKTKLNIVKKLIEITKQLKTTENKLRKTLDKTIELFEKGE